MGSSQSTNTLSQVATDSLGSDLSQRIGELTKGNPNAIAVANLVGQLPVSKDAVDDNLVDFLDQNINALIDEIRRQTGLDSDQIKSEDIVTLLMTARKYGIMAIPYVVGIIATAVGTPAAGIAASTAAGTAVGIATGIETAIYNVAKGTKTPDVLKKLPDALSYGKKVLSNILAGVKSKFAIGSAEDVYTMSKKMYGSKMGACDCDAISGGSEGEIGLMTAREYLKTSSSAAKSELAREIMKVLSDIIKETPSASLTDVEKANWYLGKLVRGPKFSNDVLPKVVNKLCTIINGFVGKNVIDMSLPEETKLVHAAEVLHSLTIGMHLEFLVVQGDIITIEENMQKSLTLIRDVSGQIIDITQPGMSESDRLVATTKKDAIGLLNDEVQRQMNMLKAITTGTISSVDKNVAELLAKEAIEYGHVTDMNKSTHSFMQLVYKLLNMMVITGTLANIFEKAAKSIGTTLDDYKNMKSLSELDKLLEKMPKNGNVDESDKFFKAYELLRKNFDRRSTIAEAKSGAADDVYEESRVRKQINVAKNERAVQLLTFTRRLRSIYQELGAALDVVADKVDNGIKMNEKMVDFLVRLDDATTNDKVIKGKTYIALAGAVKDTLALNIREELLGRFKSLHAIVIDLANDSTGEGKMALEKVAELITKIIALSDDSVAAFRKIIGSAEEDVEGGADLSASIVPSTVDLGGLIKSAFDINKIVTKMLASAKIAKVRENIKSVKSDFAGVTPEYEQLDGMAIAGVINEINEYQSAYLKRLDGKDSVFTDFITAQCETMRNVWKSAEAIDYLLGNFTHDIRLSTGEVAEISSLLEDVSLIRNMYDATTGDIFTSIFDSFPYSNALTPVTAKQSIPVDAVRVIGDGREKQHYYKFFEKDSNAGHPEFGLTDVGYAKNALQRSKAFAARFGLIKNIVALFYKLGIKYNREKTTQSLKYMSASSLVRALTDYMHYGSFLVLDEVTIKTLNDIKTAVETTTNNAASAVRFNVAAYDPTDDDHTKLIANNLATLNAVVQRTYPGLFQNIYEYLDFIKRNNMTDKILKHTVGNNTLAQTTALIRVPSLYLRSETFDYLRGPSTLVRTDDIFVTLFKSMLTKILSCIQVFEIVKRPAMYNVYNSAVRQIIGGAGNVDVRNEYIPLYIRLPWLVRFYKHIFRMDDKNEFDGPTKFINKSKERLLKISIVPDIDGLYGPLVSYIFKVNRGGVTSLMTTSQLEVIIGHINKIIDATPGSSADEKIKTILDGLKNEVNRRFDIVTKEDVIDYDELKDSERSLWGSLTKSPALTDYESKATLFDDDDGYFSSTLPSAGYVSTSSGVSYPGKVLPNSFNRVLADKKYYFEYRNIYHNFRSRFEEYMIDDKAIEAAKTLKGSIKSLAKTIAAEPNMDKKLSLLSDFISGDVNLNDYDRDKYVAFHEVVIGGMNALSILDAYVTNIISIGYLTDAENGFGKAVLYNTDAPPTIYSAGQVINLINNGMGQFHTGISTKTISRVMASINRAAGVNVVLLTLAGGNFIGRDLDKLNKLLRDKTVTVPTLDDGVYVSVVGQHVVEMLYALVNNPLFSIAVNESGINIDYSKAKAVAQSLIASVKSSLEKFRPFIDQVLYQSYVGIIGNTAMKNRNTIYELYDDLIRVKFEGQKVLGNPGGLDEHLGNYYGLDMAISAINVFMKKMKTNATLAQSIKGGVVYGLTRGVNPTPVPTEWSYTGSGIDRMHVSFDGDRTKMDLRFAARVSSLYNWDGQFTKHTEVFSALNDVVARFLGRSFDNGNEKVYNKVLSAFDKAFPAEISNPFGQGWPDIWPALFKGSGTSAPRTIVTEKDIPTPTAADTFANLTGAAGLREGQYAIVNDPSSRDGVTGTKAGTTPNIAAPFAVGLPSEDNILYASIANIVKNIRNNKNAAGTFLNVAETLSDISMLVKDRMKDEMPIFREIFNELNHRCLFLKSIVDNFVADDVLVSAPAIPNAYPRALPLPSESRLVPYLSRILSKFSDICTIFMKTADDICKDLQVTTAEYGELYPGYLKAYREKYSGNPLIPPSLAFSYMFAHAMNDDNDYMAFLPATKKSDARYLTNFARGMRGASGSWIVEDIINRFKRTIDGPETLNPEDVKTIFNGITSIIGMIGDARTYKSIAARVRMSGNGRNVIYPERMNGATYVNILPTADILTPWGLSYMITSSTATAPGIVVNRAGEYINSMFITDSPSNYLSTAMITDNRDQAGKIFAHFKINEVKHNNSIAKIDVANVLDMNIVPIDFSQFSRFMPLAHLMNFSYTFDKIVLDAMIPNDDIRKKVYEDIIKNNGFNPTSSEMMLAGLMINPWAKDVTINDYRHLYVNMMRGISQLPIGRPKFLSDQVMQKALFGEMFDVGVYDERGASVKNRANNDGTIYKSVPYVKAMPFVPGNPGGLFKTIRGGGYSDPYIRAAAGWDHAVAHAKAIETAIIAELANVFAGNNPLPTVIVTFNNIDKDDARVELVVTVSGKPLSFEFPSVFYDGILDKLTFNVVDTGTKNPAKVGDNCDLLITIGAAEDQAELKNATPVFIPAVNAATVKSPSIPCPTVTVDVSTTPYETTSGGNKQLVNATLDNLKKHRKDNNMSILTNLFVGSNYVPKGDPLDGITDGIDELFCTKFFNHGDAKKEVISHLATIMLGGSLDVVVDKDERLKKIGNAPGIKSNLNDPRIRMIIASALYDDLDIVKKLASNTYPGAKDFDDLVKMMIRDGGLDGSKFAKTSINNPTFIDSALLLSKHPIMRYFNPAGGPTNNTNAELRYVDPLREGVDRVVGVTVNSPADLRDIGYARNNTILVRLVVFMMNAYRIILYKLRQDAKMRTGEIASRPEEILDDGMVEFSGFDMIE